MFETHAQSPVVLKRIVVFSLSAAKATEPADIGLNHVKLPMVNFFFCNFHWFFFKQALF